MPYDLHTPFGIRPGQVSPAEAMQSQNQSRLRGQLMEQEAQEQQMRMLRESMGGGRRAEPAYDPYPDSGKIISGTGPKLQAGDYGTDAYFQNRHRDRAATGTAVGEADLRMDQIGRQKRAGTQLDSMLGMGPAAMPTISAQPAGPNYNALVGGGVDPAQQAAAGVLRGGGGSDQELMRMAILASIAGGGSMPDVGGFLGKQADRQAAAPKQALEIKALERGIARDDKAATEADVAKRFAAGQMRPGETPPMVIEDFIASNPALFDNFRGNVRSFADRDTDTFGWDPGQPDLDILKRDYNEKVAMLMRRGFPADMAKAQAQQMVTDEVAPFKNDVNAGWVQQLLQALGITQAPQEQAPSMMDQFPG